MGTVHITDVEVARDFMGVLAQVKAGDEVVIESESTPVAVLRSTPIVRGWTAEESIARAEAFERELGYAPVMDEDFASDMREIIANRSPRETVWDDE